MPRILLIQTAFIGDAILATAAVESLHQTHPELEIDVLVRKGNELFFNTHPHVRKTWVWDKQKAKLSNLVGLISSIRKAKYSTVVSFQRFFSNGLLVTLSGAKQKVGYKQNPLAFGFTHSLNHEIGNGKHEIERNADLLRTVFTELILQKPRIYPPEKDRKQVESFLSNQPYITISPASVWETKKWPFEQFLQLIQRTDAKTTIYILGGPADQAYCESFLQESTHPNLTNLAGKISLLGSASLMQKARMNYVNDSAPLHLCSAMNAPVCAFFCSTDPAFGFTPLSDESHVVLTQTKLDCHPCGLHGFKACPKQHFKCGSDFNWSNIPLF